jgi:hypothetical protein
MEVYRGGPNTVIASALPPQGMAIPVPGGGLDGWGSAVLA